MSKENFKYDHMKQKYNFTILFCLLGLAFFLPKIGSGQSTCETAVVYQTNETNQYQINDTVFWVQFTATEADVEFRLNPNNDSINAEVSYAEAFSGICNSLTVINVIQSNNSFLLTNLNVGNAYLMKFHLSHSGFIDLSKVEEPYINSYNPKTGVTILPIVDNSISTVTFSLGTICIGDSLLVFPSGNVWMAMQGASDPFPGYNQDLCNSIHYEILFPNTTTAVTTTPFPHPINYIAQDLGYWFIPNSAGDYYIRPVATGCVNGIKRFYYHKIKVLAPPVSNSFTVTTTDDPSQIINNNDTICVLKNFRINFTTQENVNYFITFGGSSQIMNSPGLSQTYYSTQPGFTFIYLHAYNLCDTVVDSVRVNFKLGLNIHTDTVCFGNQSSLCASFDCNLAPQYIIEPSITSWNWNFGDGGTTTLHDSCVTHFYTAPGNYNATVRVDSLLNTSTGEWVSYPEMAVATAVVLAQASNLTITGNNNNCDTIATYSVPVQNGYTYQWYVDNTWGNIIGNGNSNSINIQWNPYPIAGSQFTWIRLTVFNGFCSETDSFRVFNCCNLDPSFVPLFNDTLNSSLNYNTISYTVNGQLIINANVQFINCTFRMGPLAKISVKPGITVEFRNCVLEASKCNWMWDGIYMLDPSAHVIMDQSFVGDAINAIFSSNGGNFTLNYCTFERNYTNIEVNNFKVMASQGTQIFHPASIKGSVFTGTDYLPYFPYHAQSTLAGVHISNVENFVLGDPGDASFKNTFQTMFCGVYSDNAKYYVYNNAFSHINIGTSNLQEPMGPATPTAIHAYRSSISTVYPMDYDHINNTVYIGREGLKKNYFEFTRSGIKTYGIASYIINNQFNNTGYKAIECTKEKNLFAQITANTITLARTGIVVQNLLKSRSTVEIDSNTISSVLYKGIWVTNMQGNVFQTTINTPHVWIRNNKINFDETNYDFILSSNAVVGIKAEKCDFAKITDNNVIRNIVSAAEFGYYRKLWGIGVSDFTHGLVKNNYLGRLGAGIRTAGLCTGTDFFCNKLMKCYMGFNLDSYTAMSDQGSPSLNSQNLWMGSYGSGNPYYRKIDGDAITFVNPIKWYWNGSYLYDPQVNINNPFYQNLFVETHQNTINNNNCTTTLFIQNPQDFNSLTRDTLLLKIASNQEVFEQLQEQYSFYERDMLFDQLKSDSALIIMGNENDFQYIDFMAEVENESMAFYSKYKDALDAEDLVLASEYLKGLSENNIAEQNIQTVNEIYIHYVEKGYQLSDEEYNTLYEIAGKIPHTEGDAVYTARIILGYDPDENDVQYAPFERNAFLTGLKVYPNPAKEFINFDFSSYHDAIPISIELYNSMGQKFMEMNVILQARIQMNTESMPNGMYYYKVQSEKSNIGFGKIMINH